MAHQSCKIGSVYKTPWSHLMDHGSMDHEDFQLWTLRTLSSKIEASLIIFILVINTYLL